MEYLHFLLLARAGRPVVALGRVPSLPRPLAVTSRRGHHGYELPGGDRPSPPWCPPARRAWQRLLVPSALALPRPPLPGPEEQWPLVPGPVFARCQLQLAPAPATHLPGRTAGCRTRRRTGLRPTTPSGPGPPPPRRWGGGNTHAWRQGALCPAALPAARAGAGAHARGEPSGAGRGERGAGPGWERRRERPRGRLAVAGGEGQRPPLGTHRRAGRQGKGRGGGGRGRGLGPGPGPWCREGRGGGGGRRGLGRRGGSAAIGRPGWGDAGGGGRPVQPLVPSPPSAVLTPLLPSAEAAPDRRKHVSADEGWRAGGPHVCHVSPAGHPPGGMEGAARIIPAGAGGALPSRPARRAEGLAGCGKYRSSCLRRRKIQTFS